MHIRMHGIARTVEKHTQRGVCASRAFHMRAISIGETKGGEACHTPRDRRAHTLESSRVESSGVAESMQSARGRAGREEEIACIRVRARSRER